MYKGYLLALMVLFFINMSVPVNAYAYTSDKTILHSETGVLHPVDHVNMFWNTYQKEPELTEKLISMGVYGFEYVRLNSDKTMSSGMTDFEVEYDDELPEDWTIIFYLAESTIYDRTVFAINHGDGTATIYEPGKAPY